MTFMEHFSVCSITALFGWMVGRIASRLSRVPDFGAN